MIFSYKTVFLFFFLCLFPWCMPLNAQNADFAWVRSIGGSNNDVGNGVIIDEKGNVYVTGYFGAAGANFNLGSGGVPLTSSGSNDVFLTKYSPSGTVLWTKGIGGTGNDQGYGVAVDHSGNVYVTGQIDEGGVNFNPGGSGGVLTSAGSFDIFVAKYSADGAFVWAKSMGGTGTDIGFGVAVDDSGRVYVTGQFNSTNAIFGPGGSGGTLTSVGNYDVFLAKYDSDGTFLWAKNMGGTGVDQPWKVAVDSAGNAYIVGYFAAVGADFNLGGSGGALTSGGNTDVFLAKYDPNGVFLWAKSIGGPGADQGWGVAVDGAGSVYITGYFAVSGADFNRGGSGGALTSSGGNDIFLVKYDLNGVFVWAKSMGGTGADIGRGVGVDGVGNVYVTGVFSANGADFNRGGSGGALISAGANDIFVAKFDIGGTFSWAKSMGGSGGDIGTAVAVDANDNVYATGYFAGQGAEFNRGGNDGAISSAGVNDVFLVRLSQASCITSFSQTVDACNSYTLNGQTYTSSGVYIQVLNNKANCDSILTVNLTINERSSSTFSHTECDSFNFGTQTYKASGTYVQTFTNAANCDSVVTLNLIITKSTVNPVVAGQYCDSATFNGVTYTSSGTYIQKYDNNTGCDSSITYDIVINKSNGSELVQSACDSFIFSDTVYTVSGIYTQIFTNTTGCDSIVTRDIDINSSPVANVSQSETTLSAGNADTYQWLDCDNDFTPIQGAIGQTFSPEATGNYAVVVTSKNGCSDTSDCITVEMPNAIGERKKDDYVVRLYPNPTGGKITITTAHVIQGGTIRLINMVGQVLGEQKDISGTMFTVDMIQFASGIYFTEILTGDKKIKLKVIKQ